MSFWKPFLGWGNRRWHAGIRLGALLALAFGVFAPTLTAIAAAPAATPTAAELEFFEQKIRPILADNCYQCHGQVSTKVKGGLYLTSRDGLLQGGTDGPVIVPGDPDRSLLIKAVRYGDEKLRMPPKNKKLSPEKIADLEAWVRMGAPDPRVGSAAAPTGGASIAEQAKTHWAFQPVREPASPAVRNAAWVRNPVDQFILARLEAAGLAPSPRADARTLIRRAYFDLTGLPPKPEEVAAFVADAAPDAFARLVDRLLASPQYGERWGRHWLDVARYADTKGYVFEEERRYPYSYTYRDYVISAFNEDLPYDQFLKQQIAADLLPKGPDQRSLAALGFLTLGRRFINNIHDIIDDRIDVVCRGTMGLTMACARCHDHKYDPMTAKDYYGLYGVFAGSMEPEEEPLLGTKPDAKLYAEFLAERKNREDEKNKFQAEKEEQVAQDLRHKIGDYLLTAREAAALHDGGKVEGVARKAKLDPDVVRRWIDGLENWRKSTNAIFVPWFALASLPEKDFATQAAAVLKNYTAAGTSNHANARVLKAFSGAEPRELKDAAQIYSRLFTEIDQEWRARSDATNQPAATVLADADAESLRQVLYGKDAPPNIPRDQYSRIFDVPTSQKVRALQRKIVELDATHRGAPARAMALQDRPSSGNTRVFLRGSPDNQGPEAPRAFPAFLAGPKPAPFQHGSGRLELAEAIASRDNPLTARVMVNRVWMHHFGASLVGTPSDFGLRAEAPVQRELLDYLAARFMADGWSIKQLHRLLLLSSTYQQSSLPNAEAERRDPGNQLYWRMNRQRLEFEPMRDTLLSVAGNLDLQPGGQAVNIIDEPTVPRRSVYGYIDRQNLPGLLRAFDFASPDTSNPRRFYTTVPQQALFLMNSPFAIRQAKSLIDRPDVQATTAEDARVRKLYQLAFQREPTPAEQQFAREFLAAPAPPTLSQRTSDWLYGFGGFNTNTQRTGKFRKLPHFTGTAFQGSDKLPDPKLGWVTIGAGGGHPGNDQQHAAIRRWTAPRDGTVAIRGTLAHPAEPGDGVRGRIVASGQGLLGEWVVHHGQAETAVAKATVQAGDTIDFLTDCRENENSDSFSWAPVIRYLAEGQSASGQKMEWNVAAEFGDTDPPRPPPLTRWQQYAQVLLLTNELVFVD